MKKITYIGCFVALILLQQKYGGLYVIGNIAIYMLCLVYLIMRKFRGFNMDFLFEVKPPVLAILGIFGVGPIIGGYLIYKAHQRPITTRETDEEFEAKLTSRKREHRISNILGIK